MLEEQRHAVCEQLAQGKDSQTCSLSSLAAINSSQLTSRTVLPPHVVDEQKDLCSILFQSFPGEAELKVDYCQTDILTLKTWPLSSTLAMGGDRKKS